MGDIIHESCNVVSRVETNELHLMEYKSNKDTMSGAK